MFQKKIMLSTAAIAVLASTIATADYLPLSTTASDDKWVMFGVTGLKGTGANAGIDGQFSIPDIVSFKAVDTGPDAAYSAGFLVSGEYFGWLKALDTITQVEARVNTTGMAYNETEPVRTMYITSTEGGTPQFALQYKASFEGKKLEYRIGSGDVYSVTISAANTYSNPAVGVYNVAVPPTLATTLWNLKVNEDNSVVDYDFSDNPVLAHQYVENTHKDQPDAGDFHRIYNYNAQQERWEIYDSRNRETANDFTTIEPGKGYWGKMETTAVTATAGGLLVGTSSLSAATYEENLVEGWNLIALNDGVVRHASTGLIATMALSLATHGIIISDPSDNYSVTIMGDVNNANTSDDARTINAAVEAAKLAGTLPMSFHIRAFAVSATQIAIISNKQFILKDEATANSVSAVTTLTGAAPLDPTTKGDATTEATNLTTIGVMSKYGEYVTIVKPLTGAGSAQALTNGSSVQIKGATAAGDTPIAMGATLTATEVLLEAHPDITSTEIDLLDYDGTTDHILLASTEPFYIRDHTFTRVFAFDNTDNGTGTIDIINSADDTTNTASIATTDDTTTEAATAINNIGTTLVSSAVVPSEATKLVVVSDEVDSNEFDVIETTGENIVDTTTNDDIAKGAIKGVYSLHALVKVPLETKVVLTPGDDADLSDADDIITITINGTAGTGITPGDLTAGGDAENAAFLDALVAQIRIQLGELGLSSTVSHNYTAAMSGITEASITISGPDIVSAAYAETDGAVVAAFTTSPVIGAVNKGFLAAFSPDLTEDLKYNAVYTPNYVYDGPIFTLKNAGYTTKALVSGSTDLTDGLVSWTSLDLTRSPAQWLSSQDYSLFSSDYVAGYWAFVESGGENPLSISEANITTQVYTSHFNVSDNSTYNHYSGNIELKIDGFDTTDDWKSNMVKVVINGDSIELANSTTAPTVFSGKMSSYEIANMIAGENYSVEAYVSDGLGNHLLKQNVNMIVDYQKPAKPTVTLNSGATVALASASADAAAFYLFDVSTTYIPETATIEASIGEAEIKKAAAANYNLCKVLAVKAYNAAPYTIAAIAVDEAGTIGGGNASDAVEFDYKPVLKDAILMANTYNGVKNPTTSGTYYNNDCESQGVQTVNTGITIASLNEAQEVKIAYNPLIDNNLINSAPLIAYVTDGNVVAEIAYNEAYVGKRAYIKLQGNVYDFQFPVAGANDSTESPVELIANKVLEMDL
ncbi:MAG: hypothetical protein JXK05_04680 [Campylobacterales bacterium]|nr:hypothetical protein [Campylobacterales bacterium]